MASAHWLSANAAVGKRLCFPIIGSPKEYRYGGLKPHKYCFEPDAASGTTVVRFTDLLWFEPGCVETKDTVYAPDSFAPPIQEAILLNPTCTYPKPGGINASASALEWNKSAIWSEARAEFAAALAESVSPPLPVTVAVTKGYAVRKFFSFLGKTRAGERERRREGKGKESHSPLLTLSLPLARERFRKKKKNFFQRFSDRPRRDQRARRGVHDAS